MKLKYPLLAILAMATNCAKPADLAEMTAPVAFAIATNAIKNGKSDGRLNVEVNFQSLRRGPDNWPEGTVTALVSSPDMEKRATVTYILNGTHTATAIVEIEGQARQQYPINLVESALVFGQAQTVENHLQKLSNELAAGLGSGNKIAVFDAESTDGRKPVFGKSLSESLVTSLSRRGLTVVERKLLDSALREINFQQSGLTGDDVRKEMGRFLGADTVLVATIKGSKAEIVINARSVSVERGTVISSAQVIIPRYLIPASDLRGID